MIMLLFLLLDPLSGRIALLDHDDFLTPDALYHMAQAVQDKKRQGTMPALLYSDEA